jgi:hypothetical protein
MVAIMGDTRAQITDVVTSLRDLTSCIPTIVDQRRQGQAKRLRDACAGGARLADLSSRLADQIALGLRNLERSVFRFRTIPEACSLAALVAAMLPDPSRTGSGLCELLINAVEHGNLGITYDEKTCLLEEDRLDEEVARRLADRKYANRAATLEVVREVGAIRLIVTDQGEGFDWKPFLEFSADRLLHVHGRGIALARHVSFAHLEYRGKGNEVVAIVAVSDHQETGVPNEKPRRMAA